MKTIYLANGIRFKSELWNFVSEQYILPIESIRTKTGEQAYKIIEPFESGSDELNQRIKQNENITNVKKLKEHNLENTIMIHDENHEHMNKADILIALLDYGSDIDPGVANEIGYFYGKNNGSKPIIGLHSDFRDQGESFGIKYNAMILGDIILSQNGKSVSSQKELIDYLTELANN